MVSQALVVALECISSGPPPQPTDLQPTPAIVRDAFTYDVQFPVNRTSDASFEMIPAFPPGRFDVDGKPNAAGLIYTGTVGDYAAQIVPDPRGAHYRVTIRTDDTPAGTYVLLLAFTYGPSGCPTRYRYALGPIEVRR